MKFSVHRQMSRGRKFVKINSETGLLRHYCSDLVTDMTNRSVELVVIESKKNKE
jgi:hypothetical protein